MKITVEGDDFPKDGYRPTTWGKGDEWAQVRPLWQESNRIIKNMFGNPGVPFPYSDYVSAFDLYVAD